MQISSLSIEISTLGKCLYNNEKNLTDDDGLALNIDSGSNSTRMSAYKYS